MKTEEPQVHQHSDRANGPPERRRGWITSAVLLGSLLTLAGILATWKIEAAQEAAAAAAASWAASIFHVARMPASVSSDPSNTADVIHPRRLSGGPFARSECWWTCGSSVFIRSSLAARPEFQPHLRTTTV